MSYDHLFVGLMIVKVGFPGIVLGFVLLLEELDFGLDCFFLLVCLFFVRYFYEVCTSAS